MALEVLGFSYEIVGKNAIILDDNQYLKKVRERTGDEAPKCYPITITSFDSFAWEHTLTDQHGRTWTYYQSVTMRWKGDHFVLAGGKPSTHSLHEIPKEDPDDL